jgi:dihydroxyacetone kinase
MRGGAAIKDKMEINAKELSLFFTAAAKGIQERGKAELGDKTMLDVWMPSAKKIEEAIINSDDIVEIMEITTTESEIAMNATKDMRSKKGRSSKLGERSIGFIDPGAASSQIIIKSFYETIKTLDH